MKRFRKIVEAILHEGDKKIFDKRTGYNASKDELFIFEKLKKIYPNVIMSHTDDRFRNPETNRPFQFDFYDPDSDTGFNYNKTWTHFSEPFNPKNPEHLKDVKWLEDKDGPYYDRTIRQWTITDPIKREVAKENGIKFIEWFNMLEFENWLNDPTQTYNEYKAPNPRQYDSEDYFKQKALGRDTRGNDSDYLGENTSKLKKVIKSLLKEAMSIKMTHPYEEDKFLRVIKNPSHTELRDIVTRMDVKGIIFPNGDVYVANGHEVCHEDIEYGLIEDEHLPTSQEHFIAKFTFGDDIVELCSELDDRVETLLNNSTVNTLFSKEEIIKGHAEFMDRCEGY